MMRKSRLAIVVSAILLAVGLAFYSLRRESHPTIRNVLLISVDTCRADYLSCYGYSSKTTPNIDRIAREGVLFTQAQSTNSITLPAHCSMLTGTIPPYHGVHLNRDYLVEKSNITLAEVMRDRGFQTAAVIGAFPLSARFGLNQGFDAYDEQFGRIGRTGVMNQRDAKEVSHSAITWLEGHHENPFFLFVHYFDPHAPYEPPGRFYSAFAREPYAGEIAYTDHYVGQLLNKLRQLNLIDSTLIIVTSDHGESLGEHGEDTHAFFAYQSTIRVPLLIKVPGGAAGRKIDEPVSLIDIMPTILGAMHLDIPTEVQGVDLSDYLKDESAAPNDRHLYSESWFPAKFACFPLRALVHDNWHYIWSVKPELYDLNQDAGEKVNLVDQQQQTAKRLHGRLKEILADASRGADQQSSPELDTETIQRLHSLGYVGGGNVDVSVETDQTMEDAKDFITIYSKYIAAQEFFGKRDLENAKAKCFEIIAERPRMLHVHNLLGHIARGQGRTADALSHYSSVLAIAAKSKNPRALNYEIYQAYNNLAWVLATSSDPNVRNHTRAVELATKATQLTRDQNASALDTLAVAYAAAGQFRKAIATAKKAIALAQSKGDYQFAQQIRERLESFKDSKPIVANSS